MAKEPVSLRLGFGGDDYGYAIDLGYPIPNRSLFDLDPMIKAEAAWLGAKMMPRTLFATRRGLALRIRDNEGSWRDSAGQISPVDSMMTHGADPREALELILLRDRMRGWRFYDHLLTDRDAPSRRPQVGTFTGALADDGADVAAAIQTILEIGDARGFAKAIDDAFPGASIDVTTHAGWFSVEMNQVGLLRPLRADELSDGTLRFILLAAALFTPRPPTLMVLNEPEASLHVSLMGPLARMIAAASVQTQLIVVTHAAPLIEVLSDAAGVRVFELVKHEGETRVLDLDYEPPFAWPAR